MSKICQACYSSFSSHKIIDGKRRSFSHRKFCLTCSPFGTKDKRHPQDRLKDLDACRTCSTCQQRKPLDSENFVASSTEKTKFRWECKKCASQRTGKQQKNHKLKWIAYKGSKCEVCGYNRSVRALHFHHRNPTEKDFTLGKYRCRAWETVKAELDKCALLCANCHAEAHDKLSV
jgi:hypothetical protein